MIDLDDASTYERLDPSGLNLRLGGLPDQCNEAWIKGKEAVLPKDWRLCSEVVVAGMGGSAIAGNLAADLASPLSEIPIRVVRDFKIPGISVESKQLVVVCSFSGETEETISMFNQAQLTGNALAAIVGGGTLGRLASAADIPVLTVDAPGEPRSAVGYNLMLLASLLDSVGAISITDSSVLEAVAAAESMVAQVKASIPTANNYAKQLAKELYGGLTLVYGGGSLSGMALRWKSQINENGKSWAYAEQLPELFHNSVESFSSGSEIRKQTTALILMPYQTTPEVSRRYEVLVETLDQFGIRNRLLTGISGGVLAQSLSMIVLGDHLSYYMGLLSGINPSETPAIDASKQRLSSID